MRTFIFMLSLILFISGCAGSGIGNTSRAHTGSSPDLVFTGTIDEIENSSVEHSQANWIVVFQVEKVTKGQFIGETFSFRIDSPSKSGLEVGKRYTVNAQKTSDGYKVDQNQWLQSGG